MRHGRKKGQLSIRIKHRTALLRNLVKSLVTRKRIHTTFRKAKVASSFADSMVELAKRGDLHARRQLISKLGCPDAANTLIKQIAPHFKDRRGGYTRVLRLGTRRAGDGTELALLEFTATIEVPEKPKKPKKEKSAAGGKALEEAPKPKKEKAKTSEKEDSKISPEGKAKASGSEKKESEKKGGFLGALRKFLKGDDESK